MGNLHKNISKKVRSFFALFQAENLTVIGIRVLKSGFFYLIPSLLLLGLFFAPVSVAPLNLYEDVDSASLAKIFAFRLPFDTNLNPEFAVVRLLLWLIYLLPFTAFFSLAAFLLEKLRGIDLKKVNFILYFASCSAYLFCFAVCVVVNANAWQWFIQVPFYIYLCFLVAIVSHCFLAFCVILYRRAINPEYVEYRTVRKEFSENKWRLSIKTKFTFVIMSVICVILLSFMFLILSTYNKMFTEAVSDAGRAQAEHTAEIFESADGEKEKITVFFDEQRESNNYADTPFERIDIIKTEDMKKVVYLETWEPTSELPEFNVFAYTTKPSPKLIDKSEKSLTDEQVVEYLKRFKSGVYKKSYIFNPVNKTCKYIYPVTFNQKKGHKLVGFAIVTYKQQVLMRQYFRTKVFVFTISAIFLYLTVIFSIILSDFIFNPLLFLRKNVRKTSNSIGKLLSGSAKNTSSVKFSDTIKTKDEIRDLSLEISEMVNLIKGIMPFVSFSTLQHAEKIGDDTNSRKRSTTTRDLCFLFTDIRGFTALCEGMPAKKVVELLNQYLDIETQIILDNGGDIDKFVGDEMMAFFSGPRKEINACKAAMEIRAAMRKEQELSVETGLTYVSIGIGINTGDVIFGSVGSRTRKDFTSIGDTVNLAARLESANKAYGSKSIISEAVFQKLRDLFICRELDFITVKGKSEPVRIYEILQQKSTAEKASTEGKLIDIKNLFEKGLALYREQNWKESEKCFSDCAFKYNDLPSVVFLDRISHFKNNPPPKDWDGVFKMSIK